MKNIFQARKARKRAELEHELFLLEKELEAVLSGPAKISPFFDKIRQWQLYSIDRDMAEVKKQLEKCT